MAGRLTAIEPTADARTVLHHRASRSPGLPGTGYGHPGTRGAATPAQRVLDLQRAAGNRAVLAAIQREPAAQPDGSGDKEKKPIPHVTGYVGMNPDARIETQALKKASRNEVLTALGDAEAEKKLRNNPDIAAFVFDDIGISAGEIKYWDPAIEALEQADPAARDTIATLMKWLYKAEKGEYVLDRLVLSGHSNGFQLWGDSEGLGAPQKPGLIFPERDLTNVARAFPGAAGQVRDIMFSACETSGTVEVVARVFPNLQSAWAYAGFSADIKHGSARDIAAWATATNDGGTLTKKQAKGPTALWTRKDGFLVHDPGAKGIEVVYTAALSAYTSQAMPMIRGERDLTEPQLREAYQRVIDLERHPRISATQKQLARKMADDLLRLRKWDKVRKAFAAAHSAELEPAYAALGMTQPNWAGLTRVALGAHFRTFEKVFATHPDKAEARKLVERLVVKGLVELDPDVIKVTWI